jgi:tetratricopeptide (TPR) repeat protein
MKPWSFPRVSGALALVVTATFGLVAMKQAFAASEGAVSTSVGLPNQKAAYCQSGENALTVGDYPRAERLFLECLPGSKKSKATEAMVHEGLAEAYIWQSKLSQAASELKKAYSLVSSAYGPDSAEMARVLDGYAWLYFGQGKLDKAIESSRDEIIIRAKLPDLKELAEAQANLAYYLETNGVYVEAAKVYGEALQNTSKALGADSVPAADIMERLGVVLQKSGNAKDALQYFNASLKIKEARQAVYGIYTPKDLLTAVYFRYFDGAPNCLTNTTGGQLQETITANGVTVNATLVPSGTAQVKTTRANVVITNNSGKDISILKPSALLVVTAPKLMIIQPLNAEHLATKIEKKGESKAKWTRFWGEQATTTATTTYMGNPQWGFFPPGYGYGGNNYAYSRSRNRNWNNNNGFSYATTSMPDYEARARAMAKAQAIQEKTTAAADSVRSNALGPSTIPAGGVLAGCLDFPMTKFNSTLLQIPIGNCVFEFHFE